MQWKSKKCIISVDVVYIYIYIYIYISTVFRLMTDE